MTRKPLALPGLSLLLALFTLFASVASAQSPNLKSRIALPVDETSLITLHGNTHPYATAEYDQGAAPGSLPMHRMLLLLQRAPDQEASLDELLQQQQDKSSPNYHQWLTPQQFGVQFGPAQQDVQIISTWLQSHGFEVTGLSKGGILIEFSGTASQVQDAFHTPIHKYSVAGKSYYANSQDPQIPTSLSAVVAGVRSFHNFPARPMNHAAGTFHRDKDSGRIVPTGSLPIPQFTPGGGCGILNGPCELLGPFDLATIYNFAPLWSASSPIDGTGQTIAISGETDINPADWTSFWNMFGVASPKGKLNIIVNGPDPGFQGDEPEADIDTQWSSAVAKGATIDYVESESTETTLGVDLSAEYIVDNNLAPVMSESYGICELFIGTSGNQFYNALWQQASAQGITVFISSGDQGSAVCDNGANFAQNGLSVNGFGSTPYNVSVGGTDFNDLTTYANYWGTTNNTNQANAKGYIPEMTWNDTCTNAETFPYLSTTTAEQTCNSSQAQQDNLLEIAGGSGGASSCTASTTPLPSSCTGGYARPSWQSGISGLSSDGKRDLPDVSLFASNGFNGTFYVICESDAAPDACDLDGNFQGYGGTSVASPAFAGIMALVNQKTGDRQGNANYVFYKMAATTSNVCNSSTVSSTGANSCIFYDIPSGSTIAMPCANGSPNCTVSTKTDNYGVLSGFAAAAGYDQATGLGSVNAANLVNQWSTYSGASKATTFSAFTVGPPATITHGQAIAVAATVVPQTGTGTPTGSIVLVANNGTSPSNEQVAPQTLALTNGSLPAGTTTDFLPGGNSYSLTAHYSGDGTFAPADSSPVTVTVNPEASKTSAALVTYDPNTGQVINPNATSFPFGTPGYLLRANVMNSSGNPCAPNGVPQYDCPAGTVTLKDTYNGTTSPIDGGNFSLNTQAYAEDQPIFLTGGQHSVVAAYGGDASFNASTSAADVITVTKAPTSTNLNAPANAKLGSPVTLTASVNSTASLPANAPNLYFPAENVQFMDGSKVISGTVTYSTSQSTGATAVASLTTTTLVVGNHTITAQFAGDSNYSASSSNSATVDSQISTDGSTLTASSSSVQKGSNITFTFTLVPSQTGGPAPTGEVLFTCNCGEEFFPTISNNFQAQWSVSVLSAGTDVITVQYGGDSNYAATTQTITVTVNALASTTSVTTSSASISTGASVTLTAAVAASKSGGPAPTGTVQFGASTTSGNPGTPIGGTVTLTSGQATLTTTSTPSGTQFISATYSGDSNYSASTGYTAEVVSGSPITLSASPASVTVAPGGTANTVLTFASAGGFSGTIITTGATCTGLPSEAKCIVNSANLTFSNNAGSYPVNASFQTTAASNVLPFAHRPPAGVNLSPRAGLWLLAIALAGLLGLLFARVMTPRRRGVVLAGLTIAALAGFVSCGGGGAGGGGGNSNPGTPAGSYNVTITVPVPAQSAVTTNVTLVVQ